ncbi:MAG: MFS transporter [Chthonomonas sp.]|nr:MFS transporter [Chthonomonas sp.]
MSHFSNVPSDSSIADDMPLLSTKQQLGLSALWASLNFLVGSLVIILVPSQIRLIDPKNPAAIVGFLASLNAIPAIIVPLISGPISDRCLSKYGRRRPVVMVGGAVMLAGVVGMALGGNLLSLPIYIGGALIVETGYNIILGAYQGIIPDLVPISQRGKASGYMGVMSQVGTLLGVGIISQIAAQRLYFVAYAAIALALVIGLWVTWVGVKETPITSAPPFDFRAYLKSLWIDPRKHSDFAWVWLTRALVMLAFYGVLPFLQYYLTDMIEVAKPEKIVGWVAAAVIVGSAVSAYFGGALSDQFGRKKIVYWANAFMAAMCVLFAFCQTLPMVIVVATLFGIGFGAYISVDWALGTDVLPSDDDAGKDMAIWHVSMALPKAIASFPAGLVVGAFGYRISEQGGAEVRHYQDAGYMTLFFVAAALLALGAFFLRNVKGAR